MTRCCSHCSHNGHNSRTCTNRGVKIFGVRLTDGLIRKSASMGNLSQYSGSNSCAHNGNGSGSPGEAPDHTDGYASENFVPGSSSSREMKKGVPWTEEEHRMFLFGLQKLGKGDWRGISRNYVISRTPTQVASHAQKYFIRQSNVSRRKRRSSLFDIVADESGDTPMVSSQDMFPANHPEVEAQSNDQLPISPPLDEEDKSMNSNNLNDGESVPPKLESSQPFYPVVYPTYFPPFFPYSFPYWMGYNTEPTKDTHEVVKPMAVHSKSSINVDELVGMSKLSLGETIGDVGSSLSLKLDGSSRQSAFHANPASSSKSSMDSSGNAIHAV
ncbi:transcription factor KUA1-like [Hibiscus syriacus]|uniref:transcription factor KUA1-like n=1 Tax=Hibiscus syriacus TaxID=106335 RepID=UPI0019224138|nr:transcription factor KUA1-like [Hibiscus syriacus]